MDMKDTKPFSNVKQEPTDVKEPKVEEKPAQDAATPQNQQKFLDFQLSWCPKNERKTVNHHLLKFHSNKTIDPMKTFVPPIKMQRRDPHASSSSNNEQQSAEPGSSSNMDVSSIAPYGGAQNMKQNAFKRKTRQVVKVDPQVRRLQEEELSPWIMEDFEGKNTWVSTMEGGQSSAYVLFMFSENGFKVIPADRFYRFNQRSNFQTLSIDEAEAKMNKKTPIPRWFMKKDNNQEGSSEGTASPMYHLKTVPNARTVSGPRATGSDDELDFDEEFADDEEAPIVEGNEEDNKQLEEKMKKEMLTANLFGEAEEPNYEEEQERQMSHEGKKLQRYLKLLEKNLAYESDEEDENPYASPNEASSEEEVLKEEEELQKREEKVKSRFSASKTTTPKPTGTPSTNLSPQRPVSQLSSPSQSFLQPRPSEPIVKGPGYLALRISSEKLSRFASDFPPLRPKIITTPSSEAIAGAEGGANAGTDDSNLITDAEVIQALKNGPITIKDLIHLFHTKFKADTRNRTVIQKVIRKVAKFENKLLVLK
ncbi:transcription factor TFIIF complex alpha subunit Tfg1 [Schizosaccharomyces octosporus yFS286]|uniref:Transcription initiation factor IIF subunit alpha n=1 Tax=Schizosaccharomyces octosporus (strain yFS286) TaxID=483514 RepID=S9Q1R9_SCHOY|nr:transcription factor TFIIF complex alpha subunit Tfg1 [Schizosaccharomyces octosporus yFS286]EPX73643.1 transcription factor TFIIF complex alpha subunit Tfg1 [Schizosaccharomyces octosporus yFS286]